MHMCASHLGNADVGSGFQRGNSHGTGLWEVSKFKAARNPELAFWLKPTGLYL